MGDFLKLPPTRAGQVATPQDVSSSPFVREYPCLWEWMTLTAWEDGTSRNPTSITLFLDEGRLKAAVNDREGNRVAFVSAWTVEDLLRSVEDGLLGQSLDWRRSGGGGSGKRRN